MRDYLSDELDSHLYQSVGTHMLPLIAEAMDLPVYTRVIKGKAVARGAEYGDRQNGGLSQGTEEDETEDLTALLRVVMVRSHPGANPLTKPGSSPRGYGARVWSDIVKLSETSDRACVFATGLGISSIPVAAGSDPIAGIYVPGGSRGCHRQSGRRWSRNRDPGQNSLGCDAAPQTSCES